MAKTPEKNNVSDILESAQKIRDDAEKKAKDIEKTALKDLRKKRNALAKELKSVESDIERITGKKSESAGAGGKVKGEELEKTILEVIGNRKISHKDLIASEKMIALYNKFGKTKVSSQQVKLDTLINEKKLDSTGKRKGRVYFLKA